MYRNYKIAFFKIEREQNEKGKLVKTGKQDYLGSVYVDDNGVDDSFTLTAKAWRHAPGVCLNADLVKIEQV